MKNKRDRDSEIVFVDFPQFKKYFVFTLFLIPWFHGFNWSLCILKRQIRIRKSKVK